MIILVVVKLSNQRYIPGLICIYFLSFFDMNMSRVFFFLFVENINWIRVLFWLFLKKKRLSKEKKLHWTKKILTTQYFDYKIRIFFFFSFFIFLCWLVIIIHSPFSQNQSFFWSFSVSFAHFFSLTIPQCCRHSLVPFLNNILKKKVRNLWRDYVVCLVCLWRIYGYFLFVCSMTMTTTTIHHL